MGFGCDGCDGCFDVGFCFCGLGIFCGLCFFVFFFGCDVCVCDDM